MATNSTIGGASPDKRNLISGNGGGISLGHFAASVRIEGNLIGTQKGGTSPLGNSGDGVAIGAGLCQAACPNNVVGGETSSTANTIAFNGGNGVSVSGCDVNPATGRVCGTGNSVLSNSIFSNGLLGIDLGGDGRTANDTTPPPPDSDDQSDGPNLLQNFPEITSAKPTKKKKKKLTTITGNLPSTPSTSFTIRFFSNSGGEDEGKTLIGQSSSVQTDGDGNAPFGIRVSRRLAPTGASLTATATDPGGNTSEFSDPRAVG